MNILIVEKTGTIKETKIKNPDEIYKKCGFKTVKDFEHQVTWGVNVCNETVNIKLFAKATGRANSENKYEFPPPVDTDLYFGSVALLAFSQDDEILDLYKETWESVYEELYGGFEDLGSEDSDETDELEDVPDDMKTKEGYLKDGFVVPDDNLLDDVAEEADDGDMDEEAVIEFDGDVLSDDDSDSDSDSDEDSELSEEDYYYSD
jgi:hypothetical protein